MLASLAVGAAASAQDKTYALSDYDVRLTLRTDGTVQVEETIRFAFQQGTFSFATRIIPQSRVDSLYDVRVTSSDATITDVTQEDRRDYTIRWVFRERMQPATFALAYSVAGALRADDGDNVIDWQAIGDGWDVPIRDIDITVSIPFGDVPRDSIAVRPADEATLERTGAGWTASFAHDALAPGEGYRVIVRFPERIAVAEAGDDAEGLMVLTAAGLLVLGLIGGAIALTAWRDPSVDPETVADPQRPNLSLPHAAFLAHDSSTGRSRMFSAVLFDLAQRGHVTLRREQHDSWLGSDDVVTVTVDTDRFGLTDFENALLDEIQQHDTLKAFGQQASSYRHKQLDRLQEQAIERGWFQSHEARSNRLLLSGALLATAAVGLPFLLSGWAAFLAVGLLGGSGLAALMAGTQRHAITATGAQQKAQVLAALNATRQHVEAQRDTDPVGAAQQLLDDLPWLVLDPDVDKSWLDDLKDALTDADRTMDLPDWLDDAVGQAEEAASEAVAAFMPIYVTVISTSGATGAGAVAGAAAGAGAAGGAGGGGGAAG
jgi:hypothetical protein